jgi:hypothetical protein
MAQFTDDYDFWPRLLRVSITTFAVTLAVVLAIIGPLTLFAWVLLR